MRTTTSRLIRTLVAVGGLSTCLCPAAYAADPPIHELLERVGSGVERFWSEISAVTCIEDVRQVKFGPKRKVLLQRESRYDYLVILGLRGNKLRFEESRVLQSEGDSRKGNLSLLVTNGFSTLAMVFHPFYQGDFEYEVAGEDLAGLSKAVRVRFRHIAGTASTCVLRLRNRDFPLDLQGEAWIDPESGTVMRVWAELGEPLEDLGLRALRSDVRYAPVEFTEGTEKSTFWLPAEASIDVETPKQRWRNVHTFSGYKRFSVEVKNSVQK